MNESPLERIANDRKLAHIALFGRRHQHESPDFHYEIIEFLKSDKRFGVLFGFRGSAKSTLAEEHICIDAATKQFHNCVIVGANEVRAMERLDAVGYEFDTNDDVLALFGRVQSRPWGQTKKVLKNGAAIQAIGRDQAVRGLKHRDWRPDYLLLDDVEDRENVMTAAQRAKTMRWLLGELLPVCDPSVRVRCLATPMDSESVPARLIRDAKWPALIIPIKRRGESGTWEPTWPDRYPLHEIQALEEMYSSMGELHVFNQEYMCDTTPGESGTVFSRLPVEHRPRTYEPVYCMVDPAKTVGTRAATTGIAAWSYIGNSRIHVWKAEAGIWLPDEIISRIIALDAEFSPVKIGIEETSLEEFIRQPLRSAALAHNRILPVFHLRAPQGKIDFIKALQPYANGELTCNERFDDLDSQMANFPSGRIDLPNALAYALLMKPGLPVYDAFDTTQHVAESLYIDRERPLWLALNATKTLLTGILLQVSGGRTQIFADYVVEEEPAVAVPRLLREVGMNSRHPDLRPCVGPQHYDRWMNVGLVQALQRVPVEVERGSPVERGREALRAEFERLVRGEPAVRVARAARYTLAGFAGGYARPLDRRYNPASEPEAGLYRTLMEGLESTLGGMAVEQESHQGANWATTQDGRRYLKYSAAR